MLDFLNIYFLIYFDRNERWHFFFIDPIFGHKCYLYFSITGFSTESFKSLFFLFLDYDFFKWKRRSNDTQFSYCRWCGIWFVPLGYYISAATSEELHLLLLFYLLSCIIPCLAKRKCIRWRIHLGLWSGCVIPLCVCIFFVDDLQNLLWQKHTQKWLVPLHIILVVCWKSSWGRHQKSPYNSSCSITFNWALAHQSLDHKVLH